MTRHLSARSRLTLVYASMFAMGGVVLVLITYLLVAHALPSTTDSTDVKIPSAVQQAIDTCVQQSASQGDAGDAKKKCAVLYGKGVQAGASAQRSTTLTHLLVYSLLALAVVTVLAAAVAWVVAGRILRPVHARQVNRTCPSASPCKARATSCVSSPTRSTPCSNGSTAPSPASVSSSPTPATNCEPRSR